MRRFERTIRIGGREVGPGLPVYVIAEIGSNHDGSLERAKELVEASAEAGADAVKFQSFTAEGLLNPRKLDGGRWVDNPAWEAMRSLELPEAWHGELKEYCDGLGVEFLSTPFDAERARLLKSLDTAAYKIASGDVTNEPLLRLVGSFARPVVVSTGAASLGEAERALAVLGEAGCREAALLHCVSLYPPRFEEINLRAMVSMGAALGVPVGLSDHTPGATTAVAAAALGASIIEKHITPDRSLEGPDHGYAMEPGEFAAMVKALRDLEKAMGDGVKGPSEREAAERVGARRSIYAAAPIAEGEVVEARKLKIVRHGYGLAPSELERVVGRRARRAIAKDELVTWEDL
ncbi:MAG TPA: hypothetical protein ENJ37_05585 [Deltaproteobacteria bacterium]|nr:hypothetical protein [Deltaproteobacteria bacterium]